MLLGYPDSYPSTSDLPFNRRSFETDFQLSTPDQDPGGDGVWLILKGNSLLLPNAAQTPTLATTPPPATAGASSLYIGTWQGQSCRLLVMDRETEVADSFREISLLSQNPQAPAPLLSLAGVGLMINHWEETSRYCGSCGSLLNRLAGEWGKTCPACARQHYPRIHPCVIGLIVRNDEILLVRKPEWVAGRFSLVAGFVEFGESLEEAMAREAEEETGLRIDNIRYLGSQSWPFPSQIMHGFVADYAGGELILQEDELDDAGWFTLDDLPALPPHRSIARYLIDRAGMYLQK